MNQNNKCKEIKRMEKQKLKVEINEIENRYNKQQQNKHQLS